MSSSRLCAGVVLLGLLCWAQSRRIKLAFSHEEDSDTPVGDDAAQCTKNMVHFESLEGQDDWKPASEQDKLFPPRLTSIAPPGTFCGDTAQGAQSSCEKYNRWRAIQQFSYRYKIIGDGGVSLHDIKQGALGNCYFLAALAAITVNHPEIINNMFADRHLWGRGLFRTRWLVNGKTQTITVDGMFPGMYTPFFTRPSDDDQWWPVVLGKSWAKIFGSFKSVEAGHATEAINAITQAPGVYKKMKDFSVIEAWEFLSHAVQNKYPMSAGTCGDPPDEGSTCGHPKKYGLATGHAYAILGAEIHPTYGQVVKMFNPWNRNKYVGEVPNLEGKNASRTGAFTMTMEEFHDAFQSMTVNYVTAGYKSVSKTIVANSLSSMELKVSQPGKVWVNLVWPQERMIRPCDYLNPTCFIQVAPESNPDRLMGTRLDRFADDNTVEYDIGRLEPGTYTIAAGHSFRSSATWLDHIAVTVYAPDGAELEEADHPTAAALKILAPLMPGELPCGVIALGYAGQFIVDTSTLSNSRVPMYFNRGRTQLLYYYPGTDEWWRSPVDKLEEIQGGTYWSNAKYKKKDLRCAGKFGIDDPAYVALQEYGPVGYYREICKVATLPGEGLFVVDMKKLIDGVPTYWSLDEEVFVYYHYSTQSRESQWYLTEADRFDEVDKMKKAGHGELPLRKRFFKYQFECGCRDSRRGVPDLEQAIPCHQATNYNYMFSNIKCDNSKYSGLVQRFCSSTCNVCAQKKVKTIRTPKGGLIKDKKPEFFPESTTTSTSVDPRSPSLPPKPDYEPFRNASAGCRRIPGGDDSSMWTIGEGSCTCPEEAVLSSGCPTAWKFQPGRKTFSKKTVASFSNEMLAGCSCKISYYEKFEPAPEKVTVEPFTCTRIQGGDDSDWQLLGGIDMNTLGSGSCMCFRPDSVLSNDCPSAASEKFGPGRRYWSPKPLTRFSPGQLDACKCIKRSRSCNSIQGAREVDGFNWGRGSCECIDGAELNNDCRLEAHQTHHLFRPGLKSFSKSTLQALTNSQLQKCRCRVPQKGAFEYADGRKRKVYG